MSWACAVMHVAKKLGGARHIEQRRNATKAGIFLFHRDGIFLKDAISCDSYQPHVYLIFCLFWQQSFNLSFF